MLPQKLRSTLAEALSVAHNGMGLAFGCCCRDRESGYNGGRQSKVGRVWFWRWEGRIK